MNKQPKLNIKRILEMADLLENLPEGCGFNMMHWSRVTCYDYKGTRCKTITCIAGWTVCRYGLSGRGRKLIPKRVEDFLAFDSPLLDINDAARRIFGLDKVSAKQLFCPTKLNISLSHITPKMAATVLRNLAKTGEVDWNAADRILEAS